MSRIGSYMPMTVTGPATISGLLLKINEFGPTPLVSIYYDLSYGRKPQSMLIIDSSLESSPVLQNEVRWLGPKSAPFDIRYDVPMQLNALIDIFLPVTLDYDKKEFERDSITAFIRELNQLRRESLRKEFSDSYVLYNVSMLTVTYPFVSIREFQKSFIIWNHFFTLNSICVLSFSVFSAAVLGRCNRTIKLVGSDTRAKRQLFEKHWAINYQVFNARRTQCSNSIVCAGNFAGEYSQCGRLYESNDVGNARGRISTLCHTIRRPNCSECYRSGSYARNQQSFSVDDDFSFLNAIFCFHHQTETIFEVLKAHMKRAPSLKGAALVKLSQLKVQAYNWPVLRNLSEIAARLDQVEIMSDDWFRNVLNIYKAHKAVPKNVDLSMNNGGQTA